MHFCSVKSVELIDFTIKLLNLYRCVLLVVCMSIAIIAHTQTDLSWELLEDVSYEEQYLEDSDTYWLIPSFGDFIKLYEQQEVSIEGYLIVIDIDENFFVLSKFPYSACFFCGAAGPDSIVELQLDHKLRGVQTDQRVQVKGRLRLNKSDINHFSYILSQASIVQ